MTFGVIVGNRGFFPDHLAKSGREQMIGTLEKAGHTAICLTPEQSKHGAVETRVEAAACAELFKPNRDRIDGIIVTLAQFRRGARHRRSAAHGGPACAGADSGHARHCRHA